MSHPALFPRCYVDPQNCRLSEHDIQGTTLFYSSSSFIQPLYFSYGTCGEDSGYEFSEALHARAGQGEVVVVGIPAMDYPMHFKRAADGSVLTGIGPEYFDDGVPWEGSMISYMDAILEGSIFKGFNYTYTSNGARIAKPGSKWTATVHDVSNRVLNMGGSDFWVTPERAGMAAFSAPFDLDLHWLWVARPVEDTSFWTKAFRVFEPFTVSTWITLIGLVVFMSLVELWIFRDQWREGEAWVNAKSRKAKASVVVSLWGGYVARSFMHLLAGFPDEGQSSAQTIAWVGWSFLILIVVAAYTANLAAFLLRGSASYYIKSMDQAIAEEKIVCVALAVKAELEIRYPGARLRGLSFSGEFAEDYTANDCDAVVWSMPVVQRLPSTARFICDMNLVAVDIVLEKPWAFPASPELAPSITYWMEQLRAKTGATYVETFEQKYYADTCTDLDFLEAEMLGIATRRRLRGGGKGKAGAAGGAAGLAGQEGALGGLRFTDVGTSSTNDMAPCAPFTAYRAHTPHGPLGLRRDPLRPVPPLGCLAPSFVFSGLGPTPSRVSLWCGSAGSLLRAVMSKCRRHTRESARSLESWRKHIRSTCARDEDESGLTVFLFAHMQALVRSTYDYSLTDGITKNQQKQKQSRRSASSLSAEMRNAREKSGATSEIMMRLDNLGRDMDARLTALEYSKGAGEGPCRSAPPSSPSFTRKDAAVHTL